MTDTPLSDDYVADMLMRDAQRKEPSRYLASGLGSLLSRPRGNAPKPNTRFLRNIVRDADSHNAALKRKEEQESRARLRGLRQEESSGRRPRRSRSPETRHRKDKEERSKRRRPSIERYSSERRDTKRDRSRSPRRHSKHSQRESRREEDPVERRSRQPAKDISPSRELDDDSDSDPLESVIGPKPPPKTQARGRGSLKNSSMDTRFDSSYDPKLDVDLDNDNEGDDWDMALEAVRDRAKWRKSGAERLRAAGFTDEEVAKWETGKSGGEKGVEDVRWNKKGEGREWDRGKVVDGDHVGTAPEWGRLKNT